MCVNKHSNHIKTAPIEKRRIRPLHYKTLDRPPTNASNKPSKEQTRHRSTYTHAPRPEKSCYTYRPTRARVPRRVAARRCVCMCVSTSARSMYVTECAHARVTGQALRGARVLGKYRPRLGFSIPAPVHVCVNNSLAPFLDSLLLSASTFSAGCVHDNRIKVRSRAVIR